MSSQYFHVGRIGKAQANFAIGLRLYPARFGKSCENNRKIEKKIASLVKTLYSISISITFRLLCTAAQNHLAMRRTNENAQLANIDENEIEDQ